MHLGNARTFLINWAIARQRGWRVLLRIDDLEGPRIKPGADQQAIEDLAWLGLNWDEPPVWQSKRRALYEPALTRLMSTSHIYPCTCTRSEIEVAAVGRIEPDQAVLYPGTCRGRFASVAEARAATGREPALRFTVPEREMAFKDELSGKQSFFGQRDLGDFVIRKADMEWGYHFGNVVDDVDMGITQVVRGEDLLASTARQILIYEALGLQSHVPRYIHLPLVVGPDGRKLAKRHGDTRLCQLRAEGVSSGQMRALLARWSGLEALDDELSITDCLVRFDLKHLPRGPIVYNDSRDRPRKRRGGA